MEIRSLSADELGAAMDDLAALLIDAVNNGASVGFLPPLGAQEAREYWRSVAPSLQNGSRALLVALVDGAVAGTVQLGLESRPNGSHRAEVMKLMVRTTLRKRGIARALMTALEEHARRLGRATLVLDTRAGDPSQALYASGELHSTAFMFRILDDGG